MSRDQHNRHSRGNRHDERRVLWTLLIEVRADEQDNITLQRAGLLPAIRYHDVCRRCGHEERASDDEQGPSSHASAENSDDEERESGRASLRTASDGRLNPQHITHGSRGHVPEQTRSTDVDGEEDEDEDEDKGAVRPEEQEEDVQPALPAQEPTRRSRAQTTDPVASASGQNRHTADGEAPSHTTATRRRQTSKSTTTRLRNKRKAEDYEQDTPSRASKKSKTQLQEATTQKEQQAETDSTDKLFDSEKFLTSGFRGYSIDERTKKQIEQDRAKKASHGEITLRNVIEGRRTRRGTSILVNTPVAPPVPEAEPSTRGNARKGSMATTRSARAGSIDRLTPNTATALAHATSSPQKTKAGGRGRHTSSAAALPPQHHQTPLDSQEQRNEANDEQVALSRHQDDDGRQDDSTTHSGVRKSRRSKPKSQLILDAISEASNESVGKGRGGDDSNGSPVSVVRSSSPDGHDDAATGSRRPQGSDRRRRRRTSTDATLRPKKTRRLEDDSGGFKESTDNPTNLSPCAKHKHDSDSLSANAPTGLPSQETSARQGKRWLKPKSRKDNSETQANRVNEAATRRVSQSERLRDDPATAAGRSDEEHAHSDHHESDSGTILRGGQGAGTVPSAVPSLPETRAQSTTTFIPINTPTTRDRRSVLSASGAVARDTPSSVLGSFKHSRGSLRDGTIARSPTQRGEGSEVEAVTAAEGDSEIEEDELDDDEDDETQPVIDND